MDESLAILERDLEILEQMSIELNAYLMSDAERWAMAKGDMPRLTLGGCLMRQHRLAVVLNQLGHPEQTRFDVANKRVEKLLDENVVRFEIRSHQELHARMSEWIGHLRNWAGKSSIEDADYANMVDTRVVITATVDKLQQPPFELDPKISEELSIIDRRLHRCWDEGEFVWHPVWLDAYPAEKYWWLYGRLKCREADRTMFKIDLPTFSPDR